MTWFRCAKHHPAHAGWYDYRDAPNKPTTRCWWGADGWSLFAPVGLAGGEAIDSRIVVTDTAEWREPPER